MHGHRPSHNICGARSTLPPPLRLAAACAAGLLNNATRRRKHARTPAAVLQQPVVKDALALVSFHWGGRRRSPGLGAGATVAPYRICAHSRWHWIFFSPPAPTSSARALVASSRAFNDAEAATRAHDCSRSTSAAPMPRGASTSRAPRAGHGPGGRAR